MTDTPGTPVPPPAPSGWTPPPAPPAPPAPAPTFAPPTGPAVAGPPVGPQPAGVVAVKRRFPKWILFVVGGVVLVGALAAILVAVLGGGGASSVANDYVNALNDADIERANELARLDPDAPGNRYLTSEVWKAAEFMPTDVRVGKTQEGEGANEGTVYVDLTYEEEFGKNYATIELQEDKNGWYVSKGITAELEADDFRADDPHIVRIAGSDSELRADDEGVLLFPGVYTLSAPNEFYDIDEADTRFDVYATGDLQGMPLASLTPNATYLAAMQPLVNAQFDLCATKVMTEPADQRLCGIYVTILPTITSVTMTVQEYPTVTVDEYGYYGLTGGLTTVTTNGLTNAGAPISVQHTQDLDALARDSYGEVVDGELTLVLGTAE